MLRGALLGVGHVAVNGHLPGWRARRDALLVAAADARPDNREVFLGAFPEARWYGAVQELLDRERVDFVDICVPPFAHASLLRAALERGLHVLCEKPLVLSPEELDSLPRLVERKERALVTVHNWIHAPALAKVTELVRAAAIGAVRRCRWETLRTQPAVAAGDTGNWRVDPRQSGGGVLVDHGWHAFYVLGKWLSGAPRSIRARLGTRKHRQWPIEDTAEITLEYGETSAEVFLTWAAEARANRVWIDGTKGEIRLDGGRVILERRGTAPEEWSFPSVAEGSHHPDWFEGVIEDFFGEVGDRRSRGHNLAEAALCVTLLDRARESGRRGGEPVPVAGVA